MGVGYLDDLGYRDTLDLIVIAFCRDYEPRRRAIEQSALRKRTLMEYEYINIRLSDAAREVVGDLYDVYIREIGDKRGYAKSDVPDISETEYKRRKKAVKINIAKKLHLLD